MKKRCCFAILVLFFALTTLTVYADESAALLESSVSDQQIVLYARNTGIVGAQARIGSEPITGLSLDGQDGTLPVTTWLLLDNSLSIQQADRTRAKELLTDLVSSRSANEVFTLCTFSDHLDPIVWESQDYSELKQAIEDIQHYNQETFLTDCLDELFALETARIDVRYVRVVVISDGVDNNPGGITRDELTRKLEKNNVPIYSIGCTGKAQELKDMYAISRQTGAKYWTLSEVENHDVMNVLGSEEMPIRITLPIPASLCDGTTKGVQVTFDDGTTLQTQIDMPFSAIVSPPEPDSTPVPMPPPEPVPTPPPVEEPEETHTAADWMREHWLPIVILAFVIAALAIAGYFYLQRRKTQENTALELEDTDSAAQDEKASPPLGSIFIGRVRDGNDIMIDDSMISRRHCAIAVSGEIITVYDLDSLNGTQVDQVKLEKGGQRQARSGSTLTLADTELIMEISSVTPSYTPSYDETVLMTPEETVYVVSGKRILRITDMSRGDRCFEVPLPDNLVENAQFE
ncbi:MAG: FHA domain-containing protein [Lawsonibacter sp.]|nr:FHA domain-containing protein [Lawsonibacter sp.]